MASASPYLSEHFANDQQNRLENVVTFKLNGGFDKDALKILVDYAYTGKLDVKYNQVGKRESVMSEKVEAIKWVGTVWVNEMDTVCGGF